MRSRISTTCRTSTPRRWSTENPGHRSGAADHGLRHHREGCPGSSLHHQRLRQIGRGRSGDPAEGTARRSARGDRTARSGGSRGREGVRQRQPAVDPVAWPGTRNGDLRRRDGRTADRRIHGAAGEAVGGGEWPRREDTGPAHGAAPARAARRALRRCGRCAGVRDLPRARRAPRELAHARPSHAPGQARLIGRLTGRLAAKNPPQVLVDVAGVAYEVDVPMSTFYALPATGETVSLFTHLVVREDAHNLYGFASADERAAFRQLIRISGVGARTALAVLSGMSVHDLAQSIAEQDAARLTRIPGIGKKTAERLLLELRGKLAEAADARPGGRSSEALQALVALGYSEKEAGAAVKDLAADMPVAEAIRAALKTLARR